MKVLLGGGLEEVFNPRFKSTAKGRLVAAFVATTSKNHFEIKSPFLCPKTSKPIILYLKGPEPFQFSIKTYGIAHVKLGWLNDTLYQFRNPSFLAELYL
jgi:hypothetical protein